MKMSRANEKKTTGAGTVYQSVCSEGREKPPKTKARGEGGKRGEGRVGRSVIDGSQKLWRYLMKWIEAKPIHASSLLQSLPI